MNHGSISFLIRDILNTDPHSAMWLMLQLTSFPSLL